MSRLRLSLLASIGAGALLTGAIAAWSQTQSGSPLQTEGLRTSLDENSEKLNSAHCCAGAPHRASPVRVKPKTYGNPPGSGAAR